MSKLKLSASPKSRLLAVVATCLGLMAIAASSASAAEPVTYNVTGVAHNATIISSAISGTAGVWKCETLTISGQVVTPSIPGPVTGTISKVTPTNCINGFKFQLFMSVGSPWQLKTAAIGAPVTITNMNFHLRPVSPEGSIQCDMVGPNRTVPGSTWTWTNGTRMEVKNTSVGNPYCSNGSGYLEASFAMTYTRAS